jgi:hypothetical protein
VGEITRWENVLCCCVFIDEDIPAGRKREGAGGSEFRASVGGCRHICRIWVLWVSVQYGDTPLHRMGILQDSVQALSFPFPHSPRNRHDFARLQATAPLYFSSMIR